MKRCVMFLGKRPGGKMLGDIYIHWREARNYSWENPKITQMAGNGQEFAGRWVCIVPGI